MFYLSDHVLLDRLRGCLHWGSFIILSRHGLFGRRFLCLGLLCRSLLLRNLLFSSRCLLLGCGRWSRGSWGWGDVSLLFICNYSRGVLGRDVGYLGSLLGRCGSLSWCGSWGSFLGIASLLKRSSCGSLFSSNFGRFRWGASLLGSGLFRLLLLESDHFALVPGLLSVRGGHVLHLLGVGEDLPLFGHPLRACDASLLTLMISLWLSSGASTLRPGRRAYWKQKKALIGFLGASACFLRFSFLTGACGTGAATTGAFFGAASTTKRDVKYC